jgi:catechol 2,3-dioxygenase-like lactoylglutathione lyase family enzyme
VSPVEAGGRGLPAVLSHVELNVGDLERSGAFWGWLLADLGWEPYQAWPRGRSWRLGSTYLVLVEVDPAFRGHGFHRRRIGLNHLAFEVARRDEVDRLTEALIRRGVPILYRDRHPHAGGPGYDGVFFEDPDRIKVEVVAAGDA